MTFKFYEMDILEEKDLTGKENCNKILSAYKLIENPFRKFVEKCQFNFFKNGIFDFIVKSRC